MSGGFRAGLALLALGLAYLLAWPVDIEPRAWSPDPARDLGPAQTFTAELLHPELSGAAALDFGTEGALYTGLSDGRVLKLQKGQVQPAGLAPSRAAALRVFGPQRLLIADEEQGAWALTGEARFQLAKEAGGIPLRHLSNIAADPGAGIYLLEGSTRFGPGETYLEFLESAPNGRLVRYQEADNSAEVVLDGLHFPTGLSFGPGGDSLLISEMSRYRVLRHWLQGEKRGQTEVFVDGLPGYPDGIRWNGRDTFWLALYGPRADALDRAADKPWLRKLYARLPGFLQPKPQARAWILGFDTSGKLVHHMQGTGENVFAPITSVVEYEGWLYCGSLGADGIARLRLPAPR